MVSQKNRILLGTGVLVLIVIVVMGMDALRRMIPAPSISAAPSASPVVLSPGSVPVYLDGRLVAGFSPDQLGQLKKVSFVEPVEGKTQEGWLLRDVLLLYLKPDQLQPNWQITVTSTSRQKSAQLTWAEVSAEENMVMFDLSNRGTLKLVSKLEKLDTRDEWIQDVDKIEVSRR